MLGMQAATSTGLSDFLTLGGWLGSPTGFWLWSTLLLLIVEIFTSGFFLGALAVCTLITAGGAALGLPPVWQISLFAVSSIGSLLWIRPVFVKLLAPRVVNTNTAALVGQAGTVVAQVPAGGHGRVRLANEEWRATATRDLQVGTAVKVLAVTGNTVSVDLP